jgi:hypothetical protein
MLGQILDQRKALVGIADASNHELCKALQHGFGPYKISNIIISLATAIAMLTIDPDEEKDSTESPLRH